MKRASRQQISTGPVKRLRSGTLHGSGEIIPKQVVAADTTVSADVETMFSAVQAGNIATVTSLIVKNPDIVKIPDKVGNTPLHVASVYCQDSIFKLLIEHGVDANVRNKAGYFPLKIVINHSFNPFLTGDRLYRQLQKNKSLICMLVEHTSRELKEEGIMHAHQMIHNDLRGCIALHKKFLIYPLLCELEVDRQPHTYSDYVRKYGVAQLRRRFFSPKV